MISDTEIVNQPFDVSVLARFAKEELDTHNRYLAKLASATLVVAPDGDVFVGAHVGRGSEFEDGALGTLMETYRLTPERGHHATETPLEVFRRGISEELSGLHISNERFDRVGFYFDRSAPVSQGEWRVGPRAGYADYFGWVTSMIVCVENPSELVSAVQVSDEFHWTDFRPIDSILKSKLPKRPGFDDWLCRARAMLSRPLPDGIIFQRIHWQEGPKIGDDVTFPYTR